MSEKNYLEIAIVAPFYLENQRLFTWMQKRQEDGHLDGKWEFPGGKVEADELAGEAACREFQEEVGFELDPECFFFFKNYLYEYSDRAVSLNLFLCKFNHLNNETLKSKGQWFDISDWGQKKPLQLPIPGANFQMIKDLIIWSEDQWDNLSGMSPNTFC